MSRLQHLRILRDADLDSPDSPGSTEPIAPKVNPPPSVHAAPQPVPPIDPAAPSESAQPAPLFSAEERRDLLALAAAALPAGSRLPAAAADTLDRVEAFFRTVPGEGVLGYRALLKLLSAAALVRHRRPLARLSTDEIEALCQAANFGGFTPRMAIRALLTPLKLAYFDSAQIAGLLGCFYGLRDGQIAPATAAAEVPRHVREHTLPALDVTPGETLECDVVVIGSGAGGAVCAKELAEAGHAVILLEQGEYFSRADFTGHAIEMQRKLYLDMGGGSMALGNIAIPVPIGIGVGGTTLVNSGTCYRMPQRVLRKWREQHGLHQLTDEEMAPHYQQVEEILGVAPAQAAYLGGSARAVARGCDALGYHHGPLARNAPECDGQGVCCFGCPTGAKRSTNVSYVPLALRAGAQLVTGARAAEILVEGGRAVGVAVECAQESAPGQRGTFTVRGKAVVVAAGALMTPTLLLGDAALAQRLGRSGQLGRNLSIHPAAGTFALMPGPARDNHAIPQGYAIEEFHREGLLFEGVATPIELSAATINLIGRDFTAVMENYDRLASFGFLVEERSRGRVRPGPKGRPLITYAMDDHDVAQVKRGLAILTRIFLRAGAELVLLPARGFDAIRNEDDLRRFRQARFAARDFDLTAYHPLGTARMGVDPRTSVVDADLQAHDLPGLYICDGSVLPTSPAVNPQITIMALATRSARRLAQRLS